MNHPTPLKDDLQDRRKRHQHQKDAAALTASLEAAEAAKHTFNRLHICTPRTSGPDRMGLAQTDEGIEANMWTDLVQRSKDRRFLQGDDVFRTAKKSPAKRVSPRGRGVVDDNTSVDRAIEAIRSLSAEDYLPAIAGVEPLPGGRVCCPLPDHDDRNPSCTWTDGLWYCHACSTGGDLLTLASAITGIGTKGPEFFELARWIAERLLGHASDVHDALQRKAA